MMQFLADLASAYPVTVQAAGIAVIVVLAVLQIHRYGRRQEQRTNARN